MPIPRRVRAWECDDTGCRTTAECRIEVGGRVDSTQHRVLLTAPDLAVTPTGPDPSRAATRTDHAGRPGELPSGEREALSVMFDELLAWPPRHPASPLQLEQVAHRLGLSVSGVQDRLNAAKRRAVRLGNGHVAPVDPSYLYTLVRAGYLTAPVPDPGRGDA